MGGTDIIRGDTSENYHRTLSVTIDIEDWYHVPSVCGSPFSIYKDADDFFEHWKGRYDYLSGPTKNLLSLLDDYDIKATFFVVSEIIEHYPGLVESIRDQGHEIACHGLHHSCKIDPKTKKPLITTNEFEKNTLKAKSNLEKISGYRIHGYRAPNALIAGWMIDSLKKIGFTYDSSVCVNSFYNKTDSPLRNVSTVPYYPGETSLEPSRVRGFLEFPWAYYDIGLKIPTSGGPMLRFLPKNLILWGLLQSMQRGHTIMYFHPIDISEGDFPRIGHNRPFYWLIKGKIVEKKIRWILNTLKEKDTEFLQLNQYRQMSE